jgi:CO/xanthine dehydrogenase FAD-binding subunit
MVTAIHIPARRDGAQSAFEKLGSRKYMVISIVMVAANLALRDGRVQSAQVAVGSCSPVAQRLPGLESRLTGLGTEDMRRLEIRPDDLRPLSPIDDVRGSAGYRADAVIELCRRALLRAATGGTDG